MVSALRRLLLLAGAFTTTGVTGILLLVRRLLERIYASIQLVPPTRRQLEEEDLDANPLYRIVPALRGKFAWRQLGDFPTPVHRFTYHPPGASDEQEEEIEFWVKREDLSSSQYGGNKVRTLQYQLAACEARVEDSIQKGVEKDSPQFIVLGSGGSNQVVATKLHAAAIGLPSDCLEGFCFPDPEEMDNTLNYLSSLSLPGKQESYGKGIGRLLSAINGWPGGARSPGVFSLGGNSPAGVMGQVGAALELAEQIANGELPDLDGIVVALGSTCTTTGIVIGVALARIMGLPAFRKPGFRIHAQPVHEAFIPLQRFVGTLKSHSFPILGVGRGIKEVAVALVAQGGPDVLDAALLVMHEELEISMDLSIAGAYGKHSNVSREAKMTYDKCVQPPPGCKGLWLCGHFTAKSFALLLKLFRQDKGRKKVMLFWQTKSFAQPWGPEDDWKAFREQSSSNPALKKWAVVGGITGHPDAIGSFDEDRARIRGKQVENPDQYRALMTPVLHRSAL